MQAQRDYRRARDEFQRLERLRPKLPNEPNLLTDSGAADDVAPLKEINRWIRDEPQAQPAAPAEPFVTSAPADTAVHTTSEPPAGNFPVAAINRSPRSANTAGGGACWQSLQVQPDRSHLLFRVRNTKRSKTKVRRSKHCGRSMPARFVSSPQPDLLPQALTHNQLKPPQ